MKSQMILYIESWNWKNKLWMISALQGFKKLLSRGIDENTKFKGVTKVLSLYENHASASFLAALTIADEVHHLSTSPLSPHSYPNINPLAVLTLTSQLPYASNNFTSIYALTLPSLFPASSMPSILKECHRTLTAPSQLAKPSFYSTVNHDLQANPIGTGSLHLTIIDPSPLPTTLGPRLRSWLDDHLIFNLERQFRCINPGRLFPRWLADAGFRTDGSRIKRKCFLACVEAPTNKDAELDARIAEVTKLELRSIVGRTLWKEMWGAFVEGDQWWWEDEMVVKECEYLGTCWEYTLIEAAEESKTE